MPLTISTAPAIEPIALPDLKRYLRVDHGDDDDQVEMCGKAARIWVEHFLGRAIVNRTYALYLRSWSDLREPDAIRLPYPPLSSVTSITYTGTDGSAFGSTMAAADYTAETWREPGRVVLDSDATWPTLYGHGTKDEVKVTYVAGSGATAAALVTAQKQNWLQAIVTVARAFYDEPSLFMSEQPYQNPQAQALLWSDRFLGEVDGL